MATLQWLLLMLLIHTFQRIVLAAEETAVTQRFSNYCHSINMPTSYYTNSVWVVWEKRGAHKLVYGDRQNSSTRRYRNYLEDCWPCAGGLSAVKAIGTQLRVCVTR